MRENIRLKQQPFQLSVGRKQVSVVVVVALLILGVVFAIGLGVGRNSEEVVEQAIPAPRDALARLDEPLPAREEAPLELKAHQALTDSRSIEKTMPVPAANAPRPPEPASGAELGLALEHEVVMPPAIPAMDPAAASANSAPARASTATATPTPTPTPTATPTSTPTPTPTPTAVQPSHRVAKQPKSAPVATSRSAVHSNAKGKGAFTIQIASTPRRADAERLARRLAARRARVVAADVPGKGRWYRVQIGSYGTRESARLALASMPGVHGVVMPAR